MREGRQKREEERGEEERKRGREGRDVNDKKDYASKKKIKQAPTRQNIPGINQAIQHLCRPFHQLMLLLRHTHSLNTNKNQIQIKGGKRNR